METEMLLVCPGPPSVLGFERIVSAFRSGFGHGSGYCWGLLRYCIVRMGHTRITCRIVSLSEYMNTYTYAIVGASYPVSYRGMGVAHGRIRYLIALHHIAVRKYAFAYSISLQDGYEVYLIIYMNQVTNTKYKYHE